MANQQLSEYGKLGALARWGNRTQSERFWSLVDRRDGALCWHWRAPVKARYPIFDDTCANRIAWQLVYGPIPEGLCVLHICDNTHCVNPNHLELGTQAKNMKDAAKRHRFKFVYAVKRKGAQVWKGKFGDENPNTKHSDSLVADVVRMHQSGMTAKQIAQATQLGWNVVRNLLYVRAKHIS